MMTEVRTNLDMPARARAMLRVVRCGWAIAGWIGSSIIGALGASDATRPIGEPPSSAAPRLVEGCYEVRPGEDIQVALDHAATNSACKRVVVWAGTYAPNRPGQALVAFRHVHDGIVVEARGEVTLTAHNPKVADPASESYPAVVNHVVYFGDGISRKTVLRGFSITGGNNFVTDHGGPTVLEPRFDDFRKTEGVYGHLFFYTDGAGIKIFGRSYPTLDRLVVADNLARPCAGGVSIEHRGFPGEGVAIRNCVFRGNRALVTGSAVDLLPGSAAEIENSLFVGNISNLGNEHVPVRGNIRWPKIPELVRSASGYLPDHGSGALTVFPRSWVRVDRCTFTGNYNGMDDRGASSVVRNSIFWRNTAEGGVRPKGRYEIDIGRGAGVEGCFIGGGLGDLRGTIDPARNTLDCPDPRFDGEFRPTDPLFAKVGYRP